MLKHRLLPILFASILVTTGAVSIHVLEIHTSPSEVSDAETYSSQESSEIISNNELISKRRFHILRWHNHTINLHLRNVRARWLTYTQPLETPMPITYPEEQLIN